MSFRKYSIPMFVGLTSVVIALTAGQAAGAENAPEAAAAGGEITFSKHIAPIVQENCQECHRPGAIGPFSLLNYRQVRGWAKMIKEVVNERRMPPWFADAKRGYFSNDARLTDDEIRLLNTWIDSGMPRGDAADLPDPREYAAGWAIGEPDLVFDMPVEETIDPTGVVPYKYYTTKTNFEEDKWVEAIECRPGNPRVVHHIIMFVRDPNAPGGQTFLDSFAPGGRPFTLGDGYARKIPKGAELVWQVHYTPTGKTETDRSQFGIRFHEGEVKYEVATDLAANTNFVIPPHNPNHPVEAEVVFRRPTTLLSFTPHMHYRGKDATFSLIYPDGRKEVVLDVPNYDFNWQLDYRLAEPIQVPPGTKMHILAHFDNSEDNPYNPDPTKSVRWGDQTWEEMMLMGTFTARPVDAGRDRNAENIGNAVAGD